jgi:hypothetical protein
MDGLLGTLSLDGGRRHRLRQGPVGEFDAELDDSDTGRRPGHVAMGAGMTAMAFPSAPLAALRATAVIFAVLAIAFFARAVHRRSSAGHRSQTRRPVPDSSRWRTCSPFPCIRRRGCWPR